MTHTEFSDLDRVNRSCRRLYQDHQVALESLKNLVNPGRISASGGHLQPLKYILSCVAGTNPDIFSCLGWAGYLKDWPPPVEGERPAAYIVVLGDTSITQDLR